MVIGACPEFDHELFLAGELTPVYFGTALGNFGVDHMLGWPNSNGHLPHKLVKANERDVVATEEKFSGFVFKIQANMDPKHRDRIAFMRIVSGTYNQGMKMNHVRTGKNVSISDAVTFMAGDRTRAETAYAGDIIGLHNHGTIQIGDTFHARRKFEVCRYSELSHLNCSVVFALRDPSKAETAI